MSDPEKIIHRRSWRERKSARAEIPEFFEEDFSPSSSQEIPVGCPDSTEENPEYHSDSPPRGSARTKEKFCPTPEAEEVKEVTEVAPVNHELFPSTPQAAVQYIPIVIHTPLPPTPLPSSVH